MALLPSRLFPFVPDILDSPLLYLRPSSSCPQMPTLFSRSRTHSSPLKKPSSSDDSKLLTSDEFGRVASRSSALNVPLTKKEKKRAKDDIPRPRTASTARDRPDLPSQPVDSLPDGAFLPLCLDHPRDELSAYQSYGYLSYERHVVLGLENVTRLVRVVTAELSSRGGIATPFIFTSLAFDISTSAIKRLIQAFLATCSNPGAADAERRWRDEAKFAGPYELGMCLRWGLARVVRSASGQDVRGLIAWDHYVQFRDSEAALQYPPSHFATFLPSLEAPLQTIIFSLFTLLARLTANSANSGHTPPTLSPLFGPLLFGLGPPTLAFHHTYIHYLWATNATEHLILAFIRWQDAPRTGMDANTGIVHGSASSLGVPTRLKDWIRGYPAMLSFLKETSKNHKPQARKGARTVRVLSVRRNVRMYSPDLVKVAASWGQRPRPGFSSNERGLAASKEWDRIAPASLNLPPRYSDAFKKRMDMPPQFHPDTGAGTDSMSSSMSSAKSSLLDEEDTFGLGTGLLGDRPGEDRFRSLTDLKWGEFETMGFGGLGTDEKKLQFDLTEGARNARAAKRATLTWSDFSNSGFSRNDVPLNATLQFSTPIATTISSWPSHNAEIAKKLKKTQRALPPFGWDTEPIIGSEEMVEEAFVDVFCDLIYGGGWMDMERAEEYDRECNWAMVEFKALPNSRTTGTTGNTSSNPDPRTATSLILFEEFVPLEYRQQLAGGSSNRRRLPSLFSSTGKSKQWKPALTLNGRPYVVGHVPHIPSYREVEFEGLLRAKADTKVISLGSVRTSAISAPLLPPVVPPIGNKESAPRLPEKSGEFFQASRVNTVDADKTQTVETPSQPEATTSPSAKRLSRFKLPVTIPVPSPGGARKAAMTPSEYSTVEFETRVASYSDDEYNSGNGSRRGANGEKRPRKDSKDDESWMEILVSTQDRRIGGQEAEFTRHGKGGKNVRSDPDSASLEVAQALAAVLDRKPLSDDEADHEPHDIVDEVQLIPRRIDAYDGDYFSQPAPQEPSFEQESEAHDSEAGHEEDDQDDYGNEEDDKDQRTALAGLSFLQQQKAQRRLGYFDLHPERRHAGIISTEEAQGDDDDEESDDGAFNPLVDSYVAPLVPRKTVNTSPPKKYTDDTDLDSAEDHKLDRIVLRPSKLESVIPLSNTPVKSNGSGNGMPDGSSTKLASASKTAALIEMYRERERGTTPPKSLGPSGPAVPPSRLPVRALPTPPKDTSPPPKTPPLIQPTPLPSTAPDLVEPPIVPNDEDGRDSPARYVHGAPLHNVLEEEEEEP